MKIVMLVNFGEGKDFLDEQQTKLESMGHSLVRFEENFDYDVVTREIHEADALILGDMPLAKVSIEKAERLKFIDVYSPNTENIPFDITNSRDITVSYVPADEANTDIIAPVKVAFDNLYAWIDGKPVNVITK